MKKRLTSTSTNAEPVYAALIFLGRTRWRINRRVLEIAQAARDAGLNLPGLPNALYYEEPPKPADIDTNEEARKIWRRERARTIERNIASRGRALRAAMTLAEARKFLNEPAIYFPHHCDFRGRIYPMPTTLNIQGPDLARALLEFADGQSIEVQRRLTGSLSMLRTALVRTRRRLRIASLGPMTMSPYSGA